MNLYENRDCGTQESVIDCERFSSYDKKNLNITKIVLFFFFHNRMQKTLRPFVSSHAIESVFPARETRWNSTPNSEVLVPISKQVQFIQVKVC